MGDGFAELAYALGGSGVWLTTLSSTIGLIIGAIGLAVFGVPQLRHVLFRQDRRRLLIDHLPFERAVEARNLLRLRDGQLVATLTVRGVGAEGLALADLDDLAARRQRWIDDLASRGLEVRCIHRRRRSASHLSVVVNRRSMVGRLTDAWDADSLEGFVNEHFVVLSTRAGGEQARERLEEAIEATLTQLEPYKPELLVVDDDDDPDRSPLYEFWSHLVNVANDTPPGPVDDDLASALYGGPVHFEPETGMIIYEAGPQDLIYGQVVTVARWGRNSSETLVPQLVSVPGELIVVQHLTVFDSLVAEAQIDHMGGLALQARLSADLAEQVETAKSLITPGAKVNAMFCGLESFVIALGRTPDETQRIAQDIRQVLAERQVRPVIESEAAMLYWWRQFPGYDGRIRDAKMFSTNVAQFLNFENWPPGLTACDWGAEAGPICQFRTAAGTPYAFQFHARPEKEALGHTFVVGKSRSGKTTSLTMLATCAVARHADLRVFVFDRLNGCLTWATALGDIARYVPIQQDVPGLIGASLHPFALEPSAGNRAHLLSLLRIMTGLNSPAADAQFGQMLDLWEQFWARGNQDKLRLSVLVNAMEEGSEAAQAMQRWVDPSIYGAFCNAAPEAPGIEDTEARVTVFDLTTALEDPVLAPVITFQLFHRIQLIQAKYKCKCLVIVDEGQYMCESAEFRREFQRSLLQWAKLGIVVVLMVQRPDGLDHIDAGFARALRANMPTWLLYPSPTAQPEEYAGFELSESEWATIKGKSPVTRWMERPLLIKRPSEGESVIVEASLKPLRDLRYVFKSGDEFWREILALKKIDPEGFVEAYLAQARLIDSGAAKAADGQQVLKRRRRR